MRVAGDPRALAVFSHGYAVVVALGMATFIARIPIEISDCVNNMLQVQGVGFRDTVVGQLSSLRPLLWAAIDVTFELANGHYRAMYKTIHGVQLVAAVVLMVNLLRVRTMAGALAVPFGVAAMVGSHTFAVTVVEGYPINTFMTVVVACLAAANLSFGRPAWWRDLAAVLLFVLAVFTVESGVLVWVILVAGRMLGWRGVSKGALLAVTAVLCGYLYLRFGLFATAAPSLAGQTHASGFGFRVLEPAEQIARFGDRPWVLYGYNVVSEVLTVLFAEPKNGVWVFTQHLLAGELMPSHVIAVVSATGATLLIAWYAAGRMRDWRRGVLTDGDRLVLIFVAVLGANAVLGYSYLKDVIVSPAGVFHAVAATVAFAHALGRIESMTGARAAAVTVALALLCAGWAVRVAGIHYSLRQKAFIVRNDWMWMGPEGTGLGVENNPQGARLVRALYDDAVGMRVAGPYFWIHDGWKYFEVPW